MVGNYLMGSNKTYKNRIIEWLKSEYIDTAYDLSNDFIDRHVDVIIGCRSRNKIKCLIEGIKVFENLIKICKENSWTIDFIICFNIYFEYSKNILEKYREIESVSDIVKNMSHTPPEVFMFKKMSLLTNYETDEKYKRRIPNSLFSKLFNVNFNEYFHIFYNLCRNWECIENNWEYNCYIDIQYNEKNSEIVRNVRRLTLKEN
jgi:hypothetical protein